MSTLMKRIGGGAALAALSIFPAAAGAEVRAPMQMTSQQTLQGQAIYQSIESSLDSLANPKDRWTTIYFIRHNEMPHGEFPTVNESMVYHSAKNLLGETGLTPQTVQAILQQLH